MSIITVSSFCSGIGSAEQSFKELGINHQIAFNSEIDKYAQQTYLANFSPKISVGDMTKCDFDGDEYYSDINISGLPCQSFSLAGKRQGEKDPRGLLIYDFIRYVKKQRPKVFIIENVKGLLSDMGGVTFGKWLELLGRSRNGQPNMFNHPDTCGYNLHYRVLNAKHYGLPQNRERVFLIGIRPDLPSTYVWPTRVFLKDRLIDLLEDEVDEKYYLSDKHLERLLTSTDIPKGFSQIDGEVGLARTARNATNWKGDYITNNPSSRIVSDGNDICPTLLSNQYKQSTDSLLLLQSAKYEANRVYDSNGIARTQKANGGGGGTKTGYYKLTGYHENDNLIAAHQGDKKRSTVSEHVYHKENAIMSNLSVAHKPKVLQQINNSKQSGGKQPYKQNRIYEGDISVDTESKSCVSLPHTCIRRLTPLETMRLQGYPDNFKKPCSETQQYRMAGNSIPVHLMKAVLKPLLHLLENS